MEIVPDCTAGVSVGKGERLDPVGLVSHYRHKEFSKMGCLCVCSIHVARLVFIFSFPKDEQRRGKVTDRYRVPSGKSVARIECPSEKNKAHDKCR